MAAVIVQAPTPRQVTSTASNSDVWTWGTPPVAGNSIILCPGTRRVGGTYAGIAYVEDSAANAGYGTLYGHAQLYDTNAVEAVQFYFHNANTSVPFYFYTERQTDAANNSYSLADCALEVSGLQNTVPIADGANTAATADTSLVVTTDESISGDFLEVAFIVATYAGTATFNAIAGWTKQGEITAGASGLCSAIYTRIVTGAGAGTRTITFSYASATYKAGSLVAYRTLATGGSVLGPRMMTGMGR